MELKDFKKAISDNNKFISCRLPVKYWNYIRDNELDVRRIIMNTIEELKSNDKGEKDE